MRYLFLTLLLPISAYSFDPSHFKKPTDEELKMKLSAIQYQVTQMAGTEKPYMSTLNDLKEDGIYVDVVSGEPLFSSRDKYDSGTGWPSFTRTIKEGAVITRKESGLMSTKIEVRSRFADSHLGHVFYDGPGPEGKRYCMNGAALRFIPRKDLKREGYGEYEKLFQ